MEKTIDQWSSTLQEMVMDYANEMIQEGFDEVSAYDISGCEMEEMLMNHGCPDETAKEVVLQTYGER